MKPTQSPGYVDADYLQAAAQLLAPVKLRSYELMRAQPGQSILDVGCGPGLDTLALAQTLGPEGRAVGVDGDEAMVALANRRAAQAGLAGSTHHECGSAEALPFAPLTFDACRSERLLIHLRDPRKALREMIRVTKTDGRVVVVDSDWGTLSIDTEQTNTERQLARFRAETLLSNGYSGRQLFRLFKECGLAEVTLEVVPIALTANLGLARYLTKLDEVEQGALETGLLSQGELRDWQQELALAERQGTFFGSMCIVLVAGRKP
ncbi:methyltransferase domain-containing protein [Thiorhodococcus minor]|uniref:Methyltransferase domain-containing protein n=1 Tax=Thiorhodococcus minor TaxID=57489 RepID=A0A6M0K1T3_9GAMM|nr:methyltransferase domain-containing protein [Thiorhodococcus minor]NEV63732.1 methyltransferase domain-containing protein [Thiorhodococcus minor]